MTAKQHFFTCGDSIGRKHSWQGLHTTTSGNDYIISCRFNVLALFATACKSCVMSTEKLSLTNHPTYELTILYRVVKLIHAYEESISWINFYQMRQHFISQTLNYSVLLRPLWHSGPLYLHYFDVGRKALLRYGPSKPHPPAKSYYLPGENPELSPTQTIS